METGPNDETLKRLSEALPSFVKGLGAGRVTGKGRRIPRMETRPRKLCQICCRAFDLAAVPLDSPMTSGICKECQGKLDDGFIGLVAPEKYAFVKSERLKDMAGQVVAITAQNMAKIESEFNANWNTKATNDPS